MTGLMWLDTSNRELNDKILRVAKRHLEKYGTPANACYVHPSLITKPYHLNGITVKPSHMMPNKFHFLVGVEKTKQHANQP